MRRTNRTGVATTSLAAGAPAAADRYVHPRSFTPAKWALLLIGVLGFLSMFIVVVLAFSVSTFLRGFFALSAGTLVFFLIVVTAQWVLDPRPDTLRYSTEPGSTHFTQMPFLKFVMTWGMALHVAVAAGYSLYFVITGLIHNEGNVFLAAPRLAWLLSIIYPFVFRVALRDVGRAHRELQGACLSPSRIEFTFDHRLVQLHWEEIADVRASTMGKAAGRKDRIVPCVRIEDRDGRVFNIEAFELGSDPNVVAAFIRHHRDHPQAREWLVDPVDAIHRFQDAHTQTPSGYERRAAQ